MRAWDDAEKPNPRQVGVGDLREILTDFRSLRTGKITSHSSKALLQL